MKLLPFICMLFIAPLVATDNFEELNFEELYEKRIERAKKETQDLQQIIQRTLGAKPDNANRLSQKIRKKLDQFLTAPPSTRDVFREEFVPLLNFILPPEQFFSESEARTLIASLSLKNLSPLEEGPAPLKLCYEKWNALVAHAESILIPTNQTVWFHKEWEEFASRIANKISEFALLTPKEALEIFEKFLYFYNQLSRFEGAEQTLKQALQKTRGTLPAPLVFLIHMQNDLKDLYRKRAKILWEILSETINVPGKPKSFEAIPRGYFLDTGNPIKKKLRELTAENPSIRDGSSPSLSPQFSRTTEESISDSPHRVRTITTVEVPKGGSEVSVSLRSAEETLSGRSVGDPLSSNGTSLPSDVNGITPVHSASSLVSESGSGTPLSVGSMSSLPSPVVNRLPIRISSPQDLPQGTSANSPIRLSARDDTVLVEEKDEVIIRFSDETVQNADFVKKFKEAFAQPLGWRLKVENFRTNITYLRNVKFVLYPLKKLFESYEGFKDKLIFSSNRIKEYLTPSARMRMPGQPSARISQLFAYRICNLLASGPLCFGLRDNAQRIAIDLSQRVENIDFSVKADNPFRVGPKQASEQLMALFGIPSEPSAFIVVDEMEVLALDSKFKGGTRPQVNACNSYLEDTSSCMVSHIHEFVMAQQTNLNQPLNAWLQQVLSGGRPFDELCPFSYGITTLFTILTRSKAMDNNFVVEAHGDKVQLKRVGFDLFLDPSFQDYMGSHLFVGGNVFLHLPYAKQKVPDDVKQHFRNNNILLICAHWITYLQKLQLYFNELILQYKLGEALDDFGVESGIVGYTQVIGQGLTMSRLKDTIPFLILTYNRMIELLDMPTITYQEVFDGLRPYEALIYKVFDERAKKCLQDEYLIIFFKQLIPQKITELAKVTSGMQGLGWTPPYSTEEINSIKTAAGICLKKLEGNKAVSLVEILPNNLNPKVQAFFEKVHEWALRTGFFKATVGVKAHELCTDGGNDLYLYEELVKEYKGEAPKISWDSIPVMPYGASETDHQYLPDYLASVIEAKHPVEGMVQDLFEADISKMPASSALKFADLLLNINARPVRYHTSWPNRLIEIAERNYFSVPPRVLTFIEGLGFGLDRQRAAMQEAHLQRFKAYESCLDDVDKKLKPQPRLMLDLQEEQPKLDRETTLPGYLLRQLFMVSKLQDYTQKEAFVFAGICDLLLNPAYSSREVLSADIASDPGCLGLASNPIGKRGIWEIHPNVGDHYLLTWSENWAELFRTPDFVSEKVRSVVRSAPLPLFCLQWLEAQRRFGLRTQFHPWFPKGLIEKLKRLQQLMASNQPLTFNHLFLALAPDVQFIIEKEFKTQASRAMQESTQTQEEKEAQILKEVLKSIRARAQKDHHHSPHMNQTYLKDLSPIEGKDDNLEKVQAHLDQWDMVYETADSTPPLSLDEVATQSLYELNPADYGPEIVSRTLYLAAQFKINPTKINRDLWRNPQILEDLLRVKAPLECIQLAATLRAGRPISVTKPRSTSFAVSGTEGDVEFLGELISLFPKMAYLHPEARDAVLTGLSIPNNHLRSLFGVMPTLLKFPALTFLNISHNPIHNPTPLRKLTQLETLDVSNTCIHLTRPLTKIDQLLNLFMKDSLSPEWQDFRRLIDQIFLHKLRDERIGKESTLIDDFLASQSALIPLPNLKIIVNEKNQVCSEREAQLLGQPIDLWSRIEGLLKSDENKDLILSILEQLSEQQWEGMLKCWHVINERKMTVQVIEQLAALLQDQSFHPRLFTFKLFYALIFGLPPGTDPYSLYVKGDFQSSSYFQCTSLRTLEIVNVKVDPVFLGALGKFTNLETLILINNNQPEILACLPRLPSLVQLVIKGSKLTSLEGLFNLEQHLKFTDNLTTLILKDNLLTNNSNLMLLLNLLKLQWIDLSDNKLTKLPQLGNLQHLKHQDYRGNDIPKTELKGYRNTDQLFVTPQRQ